MSWVREALVNHGDPMVTAPVLHSGHDVVGGNRGYPMLTVCDYWNCTGVPALWCSWLPELLYKKQIGTHREKKHVLTLTLMLVRRKSACKTSAGSSKTDGWPHFWVQIWTPKGGPSKDLKEGMKM